MRGNYFWLVPLIGLLASCGGGGGSAPSSSSPPPPTYTAKSSVAQKGPLIKGSTVTVQELDATLAPTGKQYSYQTTSDLGTFDPSSSFGSQYLGVAATGYYFDELLDQVSDGTVTLNGYSDLSQDSAINVNLLTTLAYQRIQKLIANSGLSFAAARTQAEKEVLTALHIPSAAYVAFDDLDVSGNTDGDHILAAVSSLFVYGNPSGPMSALIANVQNDIGANGAITVAATRTALAAAGAAVNPNAVAANLTQRYATLGVNISPSDISDWIDRDGDGVVGKFKFQVPDATPTSLLSFPTLVIQQIAGTSVSVTGGELKVNGSTVSGAVAVKAGDAVAVTPGAGMFPNGVLTVYLLSGGAKTARVSFVSGLTSIAVTEAAASIPKGVSQQFKATGTFSDNHTADLTSSVSWTSSTPAVASIASSGLAQALTVGSTVIKAASGSIAGSIPLDVSAAVIVSLAVSPNPAFSGIGLNTQLTATGTYSDASTADVSALATWSSDTPSVATVGNTGLVTGASLGSSHIAASIGTVTSAPVVLSVTSGLWHPEAAMNLGSRSGYASVLLPSGKVMAMGGWQRSTYSVRPATRASSVLYDPNANTWVFGGPIGVSLAGNSLTRLQDGRVLAAGGESQPDEVDPIVYLASAEIYDPTTDSWSSAANMSQPREGNSATLLADGRVLVVGGEIAISSGAPATTAEIYDPSSNTWSAAAGPATAVTSPQAILLPSGKVLIGGGYYQQSAPAPELYDPVTNSWSLAGNPVVPRSYFTTLLLGNGKVLTLGGEDPVTGAPSVDVELYDPSTNSWSSVASLPASLVSSQNPLTAVLLPSGKVLALAGGTGGALSSPAALYDPLLDTWTPTGSLPPPLDVATLLLLPDGRVLALCNDGSGATDLYWQ